MNKTQGFILVIWLLAFVGIVMAILAQFSDLRHMGVLTIINTTENTVTTQNYAGDYGVYKIEGQGCSIDLDHQGNIAKNMQYPVPLGDSPVPVTLGEWGGVGNVTHWKVEGTKFIINTDK